MSTKTIEQYLKEFAEEAELVLDEYFNKERERSGHIDPLVEEFLWRYRRLLKGGKKIRGSLTVLGYECFGGKDREDIIKAGCFIEMTHASLLIHDDIHDQDFLRRGLPTLHKQFEEYFKEKGFSRDVTHYGISMGDTIGLLGSFFKFPLLLETKFAPERLVRGIEMVSYFLTNTDYGQAMDITFEHFDQVAQEEVMRIHRYKTADYTVTMPFSLGAILAGVSDGVLKAIEKFGIPVGIAFQIRDDIIGMFGSEEVIGKSVGSDIREGKNTLLYTQARQKADKEQNAVLDQWYGNPDLTLEGIEAVRKVVEETGSLVYSERVGWQYVKEGKEFIREITTDSYFQDILSKMADFMMERES